MFDPFMGQQLGPTFESAEVPRPMMDPDALNWAMQQQARQEAIRAALDAQYQNLESQGINRGIQIGGNLAGRAVRPVVRPLAQEARQGIARLLTYSKSSPVTAGATASSGGNALLGTASPASAAALNASAAPLPATVTSKLLPDAAPYAAGEGATVLGSLGTLLGAAGVAHSAYSGLQSGHDTLTKLQHFERAAPDEDELERARYQAFRAGMVDEGIGAAEGGLGGFAVAGPIGAGIGALAGGAGGALTATRAYKDSNHPAVDTAHALARFMRNPTKK